MRVALLFLLAVFVLISLFLSPAAGLAVSPDHLLITEIVSDPTGEEPGGEWVEIFLPGGTALSLKGWRIRDNTAEDALPDITISPGEYVVIAADEASFRQSYPRFAGKLVNLGGPIGNGLANGGDRLQLVDVAGVKVDAISYGSDATAFNPSCSAAGEGQSLARYPSNQDTDTSSDWVVQQNPTPGGAATPPSSSTNTPTPPTPTKTTPTVTATATVTRTPFPVHWPAVLVTEVMYDPVQEGTDSDWEWVELKSVASETVHLGGWQIGDSSSRDTLSATDLAPGQFVVVAADASAFRSGYAGYAGLLIDLGSAMGNGLSNSGDSVRLWAPDGSAIDGMSYGTDASVFATPCPDVAAGHSLARVPDTADTGTAADWIPQNSPNPGASGRAPTATPTPTATRTSTATPTAMPVPTYTHTPSPTVLPPPTGTPTITPSATVTAAPNVTPTGTWTPAPTGTPTATPTATGAVTATPTHAPAGPPTETLTPTATVTSDTAVTPTATATPTATPTIVFAATPSPTFTRSWYVRILIPGVMYDSVTPGFEGEHEGNAGYPLEREAVNPGPWWLQENTGRNGIGSGAVGETPAASDTPSPTPPVTPEWTATATSSPIPTPSSTPSPTETPSSTPTPSAEPTTTPSPTSMPSPTITPYDRDVVRLNEIMAAPSKVDWDGSGSADSHDEYIELYNTSAETVILTGWQLDDREDGGSKPYVFPEGAALGPRGYLVLFQRDTGLMLNNDADTVRLLGPDNALLDDYAYKSPRYDTAFSRTEAGSWTDAYLPSPGRENAPPVPTATPTATPTGTPIPDGIRLNELLPDPQAVDWDGDGQASWRDEWVELVNVTDSPASLGGWRLVDATSVYTIPQGTVIWPKGYLLLFRRQTSLSLGDWSDEVRLLKPDGTEADRVLYDFTPGADRSYGRSEDGAGYWTKECEVTPGRANQLLPKPESKRPLPTPQPQSGVVDARRAAEDTRVTVTGVVVLPPGLFAKTLYLQDEDGGLKIYLRSGEFPALAVGDEICVTGWTRTYHGESELSVPDAGYITKLGSGRSPAPRYISTGRVTLDSSGQLVIASGRVIRYERNALLIDDGSGSLRIYFPDNLGWRRPYVHLGHVWWVQGVLVRSPFEASADVLELVPRFQTDVSQAPLTMPVTGGGVPSGRTSATVGPQ